jgi:pimeloyl-ACP methyl ester carboxylesterase
LVAIPRARGAGASPLPTLGELGGLRTPVLRVAGDRDGICPVQELRNLADWIPEARTLLFRGADHFFGRREGEVAASVGGWLDEVLPQ